ncbi:MAG: flagellar protein FliT [Roseburia sp.]|nr:flagellar protein FliT [Roseburia sp.]MCM1099052.1 flagellar protein FliT [Ruminococcus flavefaciens]
MRGEMTENYLNVLEDSLQKKLKVLAKIRDYNQRQEELFRSDDVKLERFDEYVEEKGALIDEVTALDNGFETLYGKVAEELKDNREKYAGQIRRLQELVSRVTEESVSIQAQEARNKKLVEDYFHKQKMNIGQSRKNSKAVFDYYRSMSQANAAQPQFMDNKQ